MVPGACSDGIIRWVKKKTGPPAADVADKAALTAVEKDAEVVILGYFTEFKVRHTGCWLLWAPACMFLR